MALAIALHVAVLLPAAGEPPVRDVGTYAYHAWRMSEGETLYRDLATSKFPGALLLISWCAGLLSDPLLAVLVLGAICRVASIVLFAGIAGRLLTVPGAGTGAVLAFAVLLAHPSIQGHTNNLEIFLLPFVLALALIVASGAAPSRSWVLAGMLGGAALTMKQVALPYLAWTVWRSLRAGTSRERIRNAMLAAAGCAIPLGAMIGWLAWHGILREAITWTLAFAAKYASEDLTAAGLLTLPVRVGQITAENPVPWLGCLWFLVRRPALPPDSTRFLRQWLLVSLIAVVLPVKWFLHYFILLAAPVVMASACALASDRRWMRLLWGIGLLFAGVTSYLGHSDASRELFPWHPSPERSREAVHWGRTIAPEARSAYMWGFEPVFHLISGLPCPVAYPELVLFQWHVPDDAWRRIIVPLRQAPPEWLVIFEERLSPRGMRLASMPPLGTESGFLAADNPAGRWRALSQAIDRLASDRYELFSRRERSKLMRLKASGISPTNLLESP